MPASLTVRTCSLGGTSSRHSSTRGMRFRHRRVLLLPRPKGGPPWNLRGLHSLPLINKTSGWASFDLQVTASWAFGPRERHLVYVGSQLFRSCPQRHRPHRPLQLSPYFGGQLRIGKKRELEFSLSRSGTTLCQPRSSHGLHRPGEYGCDLFLSGITVYIGRDMKPATQHRPPRRTTITEAHPSASPLLANPRLHYASMPAGTE